MTEHDPDGVTLDALFDGAIELFQPKSGYRANVDALLLAAFACSQRRARHAVDLGAGVGTVSLALMYFGGAERVTLVENDAGLAALARRNTARAGLVADTLELDVTARPLTRTEVEPADLIVCNPPFHPEAAGTASKHPRDRAARSGLVEPFLRAARALLLDSKSRFCLAYPARSLQQLLATATELGLVAKRLRLVHARIDEPARLALVELRAARPGGLSVEPPLVEWTAIGVRSAELSAVVSRRAAGRT